MTHTLTRTRYVRWRTAIFAVFLCSGMSVATWASRLPAIKTSLAVENSQIGALLLVMGIAAILGISTSPAVLVRTGARRGILTMMLMFALGVALVGLGTTVLGSIPVVMVGIVLFGFGNGCVDVMMNVEAAAIEQHAGRTILPLFHAFFSLGTVVGAGIGWLAAGTGVSVGTHCLAIAAVMGVTATWVYANIPQRDDAPSSAAGAPRSWRERLGESLSAWREPRTYALGIVMLGVSFAEGGANDWLALAVSEDHGAGPAAGAAALAVFSAAMTLVRVIGGPLVDRFGRVPILRMLSVAAVCGLLLFILAPNMPLVFVGAVLWGIGVSLGFPLGMSAAADDPSRAAARVSAAATIGYVAFLAGPPLLGIVSDRIGLLNALFILVALVAASGLASGAAKPLPGTARR